jgi:DUF4097 and DUF4098 domain-containing protein YvlB
MKRYPLSGQKTLFLVLALSILFLNAGAAGSKVVDKTFKPKEMVKISVVSGDCVIKTGSNSEIKVHLVYTYKDNEFEPVFEEEGNTLVLKEKFHKTGESCSHSGKSDWTVTVPAATKVDYASASGDLEITGLKSDISGRVASGDITLKGIKGSCQLKSASGDIEINDFSGETSIKIASGDVQLTNVSGAFDIKSASGGIEASGINVSGESNFNTVSGELLLTLAKTCEKDLKLATVSGDVTLDYNGNPLKGKVEFKGMKGNIDSDIPFDDHGKTGHSPFITKTIDKGSSPEITLKAVSGKLSLKK